MEETSEGVRSAHKSGIYFIGIFSILSTIRPRVLANSSDSMHATVVLE